MLKKLLGICAAFALAIAAAGPVAAEERGTLEEAQAMAERAAALLERDGAEAAFAAFNAPAPEFLDRDLYVFVLDSEGVMLAHGVNAMLLGRNLKDLRDPTGRLFIEEMLAVTDTGWVDYSWQSPQTKAIEPKRSYIVRVGPHRVGVGAYVQ